MRVRHRLHRLGAARPAEGCHGSRISLRLRARRGERRGRGSDRLQAGREARARFRGRFAVPADRDPGAPPGTAPARRIPARLGQGHLEQAGRDPPLARCRGQHRAAPRRSRPAPIAPAMPRVYVAIGGHTEPERRFVLAAGELRRRFPGILFSTCYRNPAFGFKGADFLNAVAGFDNETSADQVLAGLHEIELRCGRRRDDPKWGPRAMDIDLLLYGATVAGTGDYRLPRPDLLPRAYMLAPLG